MYCEECGAKIPDDSRYCEVCGAAVRPLSSPSDQANVDGAKYEARNSGDILIRGSMEAETTDRI